MSNIEVVGLDTTTPELRAATAGDNYILPNGNVGIGGTPLAYTKSYILGTLPTGSATSAGMFVNGTVPSGTTSDYIGFWAASSTQATSFTLSNANHFYASGISIGAGSTVTNQFGFRVTSGLTAATNNYGFYSDIASGSNRWNFYAAGTAQNYFAGAVGIGAAPTCSLLVFTGSTADGIRIQRFAGNYYSELRQTDAQEGLAILVGDGSTVAERLRIKGAGQTRFKPRAGNPSGAEAGDVYYDSNDNKLKVYNGTTWVDLH